MARSNRNDENRVTFDTAKDYGSSASESDDENHQPRTVITAEPTSSTTPTAKPAGPTVEQAIDRVDDDGLRGPTAACSEVQCDHGRVTQRSESGIKIMHISTANSSQMVTYMEILLLPIRYEVISKLSFSILTFDLGPF